MNPNSIFHIFHPLLVEVELKQQGVTNLGLVFDKVVVKNPKVAEELLNLHLDISHDNLSTEHSEQSISSTNEAMLTIDMSPFRKSQNSQSCHESASTHKMLEEGYRDLIKHPVTESFVHAKWQKLNWLFYLNLLIRVLFALATTVSVALSFDKTLSATNHLPQTRRQSIILWVMFSLYLPMFFMMIFNVFRKRSSYLVSSWISCLLYTSDAADE